MKRISTHVLDTALGKPATGMPVRLEKREEAGNWTLLLSAHTDQDGRCAQLLPDESVLSAGLFRLAFDTESYFCGGENHGFVSFDRSHVSSARRRDPFSHPAAAEPEWIHDVPGNMNHDAAENG